MKKNQQETNEKKRVSRLPSKASLIFRAIAGGYVLYLAYQILTGMDRADKNFALFLAFALLFVAGGIFFIVSALLALKDGKYQYGPADEESREREEQEAREKQVSQKHVESGETLDEEVKNRYLNPEAPQDNDTKKI